MRHLSSSQRILISCSSTVLFGHTVITCFTERANSSARYPFAMSASLLVVIILTAGLVRSTLELNRIHHELDRAEASFQTSRSVVDELFTRIDERPEFEAFRLQPLRSTLLENLLRYYENILVLRGNDPTARELAAEAQFRIGRIDRQIGLPDVAAWQLERGIKRYEDLIAHDPGEPRYQNDLASLLVELGEVLVSMEGRGTEASPFLERAQAMLEASLAAEPGATACHRELARVLVNLAEVERMANDLTAAQLYLTRAISILDALSAANPQRLDARIALATAEIGLGRILSARPEVIDQASLAFGRGIDIRQAVTREYPHRFDQIHELALDHRRIRWHRTESWSP